LILYLFFFETAFLVVALLVTGAWTVDVRVGEDVTLECRFNPVLMDKRHTFYWIRANIKEKDNVAIGESPLEKNYR
jgi:echinoid protein